MSKSDLIIDKLITVNDAGIPSAPSIRQLLDRDIRLLYTRDKSKDKQMYLAECTIIYYLGDPKSSVNQSGLSMKEGLQVAIKEANLSEDYSPDELVIKLINRYNDQNLTEAGKLVNNILETVHNINIMISKINRLINEKLNDGVITLEEIATYTAVIDTVKKQATDLPMIVSKLKEAKEKLLYEQEDILARGGGKVLSSMDAENYK